jgi:hypothetical protein
MFQRLVFLWVVTVSFVSAASGAVSLERTELRFEDITLPNGSKITFEAQQTASYLTKSDLNQLKWVRSRRGLFRVYVDLKRTAAREEYRVFNYDFFVERDTQNIAAQPAHFLVQSDATGTFIDQSAPVRFTIVQGKETDSGQVPLPVHGFSNEEILKITSPPAPIEAELWSETAYPMTVQNLLKDLPLLVWVDSETLVDHRSYWQVSTAEVAGKENTVQIDQGGSPSPLRLRMKPAFWAVIGALVKPLPVGEGLDTIRLSIGYESGFGGRKRRAENHRAGIPSALHRRGSAP